MNIYENYVAKIIFDILENLRYLKDNLLGIIMWSGWSDSNRHESLLGRF